MHRCGSVYGLDVAGRVLALAEQKLNIIQATCSNQFWLWRFRVGYRWDANAEAYIFPALSLWRVCPDVRGKTNGWDGRAVPVEVQYGSAVISRRRRGTP
jgi:hypothetical protein